MEKDKHNINEELFFEMVGDWKADHAETAEGLEIGAVNFDQDLNEFVCHASDKKDFYILHAPDGENIVIDYIGCQ